jgi:hypothetical protein
MEVLMTNNRVASLTKSEMILLGAYELYRKKKMPFRIADLTIAAWEKFPVPLGIRGHPEHPDTNQVIVYLTNKTNGLLQRYWLARTEEGTYQLTTEGRREAMALLQIGAGVDRPEDHITPTAVRISTAKERFYLRLEDHPVARAFEDGRKNWITFSQALDYWGVSRTDEPKHAMDTLQAAWASVDGLTALLEDGPLEITDPDSPDLGRAITEADGHALRNLSEWLRSRFAAQIKLLDYQATCLS